MNPEKFADALLSLLPWLLKKKKSKLGEKLTEQWRCQPN
jgi:hypothetical protein